MPFGLQTASNKFQHATDVISSSVKWQIAFAYLDNNVIFRKTPEQHIDYDSKVLFLLYNAGASLKRKNCIFFTDIIDFLGHVTRPRY